MSAASLNQSDCEKRFTGIVASRGLADGHLHILTGEVARSHAYTGPEAAQTLLERAIALAAQQLTALPAPDDLARDIIGFQEALLEDDDLLSPVFEAVQMGSKADIAWTKHIDREIAAYRADADSYLVERADDLLDLKLRVLNLMVQSGGETMGSNSDATRRDLKSSPRSSKRILIADTLTPSRFLETDWDQYSGAATIAGSKTSHVSLLARSRGIPLLVGLDVALSQLEDDVPALLCADVENEVATGELVTSPSTQSRSNHSARASVKDAQAAEAPEMLLAPAATTHGVPIATLLNIDEPTRLETLDSAQCDGIGLMRSEFLFHGDQLPSEDEQTVQYERMIDWARGRPVTIRTLDAGGDKPVHTLSIPQEANPFLGTRGVRLSLAYPEVLKVQLRALCRAAVRGPLKIMVPMVTVPEELNAVRDLLGEACATLRRNQIPFHEPPLGMMVEVPSAALSLDQFNADFFSVGTNDLIQYANACARDNPAIAHLFSSQNTGVLRLIEVIVAAGRKLRREVSVCGDMASEPNDVPAQLALGVTRLSIAPAQMARVKQAISTYPASEIP